MQQTTTPLKGTDGSKRSAAPPGESGGVAMVAGQLRQHMELGREIRGTLVAVVAVLSASVNVEKHSGQKWWPQSRRVLLQRVARSGVAACQLAALSDAIDFGPLVRSISTDL